MIVEAEAGTIYKAARRPFERGQVRVKMWNGIAHLSDDGMYETWSKRVREYWELQERTYGVRFGGITLECDIDEPNIIVSRAVVADVLPGARF